MKHPLRIGTAEAAPGTRADGQVFGMRTMPSCLPGDWACSFGQVQETLDERGVGR